MRLGAYATVSFMKGFREGSVDRERTAYQSIEGRGLFHVLEEPFVGERALA